MWFFRSPTIVFGEEALLHLREIAGQRAFVVTDKNIAAAGLLPPVLFQLEHAGIAAKIYDAVPAEPTLQDVEDGIDQLDPYAPDWIVAVGGGSVIDAAKAMWIGYENPDLDLVGINPLEPIVLREKAKFAAIPTTAGTGSEATWAIVLSEPAQNGEPERKVGTGHPQAMPDLAIVDPVMTMSLPEDITADTGLDALTQAIEGYITTWANDFSDGLCLVATKLAFAYLPKAFHDPADVEAREKMAVSASLSGLGYINAMVGAAHSMGHAIGALLKLPHGRAVGLCLPYVIEYSASAARPPEVETRYADIVRFLGDDTPADEAAAGAGLAAKVRALIRELDRPLTLAEAGVSRETFEAQLSALIDATMNDTVLFTAPRQPTEEDLRKLFECAYSGDSVDF